MYFDWIIEKKTLKKIKVLFLGRERVFSHFPSFAHKIHLN